MFGECNVRLEQRAAGPVDRLVEQCRSAGAKRIRQEGAPALGRSGQLGAFLRVRLKPDDAGIAFIHERLVGLWRSHIRRAHVHNLNRRRLGQKLGEAERDDVDHGTGE